MDIEFGGKCRVEVVHFSALAFFIEFFGASHQVPGTFSVVYKEANMIS